MKLPISCLFAIFLVAAVNAGFWDDLVSTVSEKVNQGAEFVQKKALPAISDGFEDVKTSIQESEFPDKIHSWAKDEAAPKIAEGWESVKKFVHNDVVPRAKSVYNAAVEGPSDD